MLIGSRQPKIAPKKPARVEPKSHFANERTFIQWISAALMLVTISVLLLGFNTNNGNSLIAGLVLNCCACFISVYAVFLYFRRLKLLNSGSPYGYIDYIGPIILVVCVLAGVIALSVKKRRTARTSFASSLSSQSGACFQHPTAGVSSLELQPSDIVVDEARGLLLVPSFSKILGLPISDTNGEVKTLLSLPGMDLEAMTFADDRLFAISEDSIDSSELIELEWNGTSLALVNRWTIPTLNAEGIAYVPYKRELYVAGDMKSLPPQERGFIDVYNIPDRDSNEIESPRHLNKNLLDSDLEDSKIAALTYFEGVLYVLHDNARLVRAWDIEMGRVLFEFTLPQPGGTNTKQWEGLAFERIQNNERDDRPLLRGDTQFDDDDDDSNDYDDDDSNDVNKNEDHAGESSTGREESEDPSRDDEDDDDHDDRKLQQLPTPKTPEPSSLVMYLTLASPPQVWSFAVTEQGSPYRIALPSCAAA